MFFLRCGDMVAILISRPLAAAFVRPVDPALVPGYAEVVSRPMDLVRELIFATSEGRKGSSGEPSLRGRRTQTICVVLDSLRF